MYFIDLEKAFDRVPCESSVTVGIRFECAKFRQCGQFLYEKRFSIRLKMTMDETYMKRKIMY